MSVRTLLRGLIVAISIVGPLAAEAGQEGQPTSGAVQSMTEAARPEEAFTLQDRQPADRGVPGPAPRSHAGGARRRHGPQARRTGGARPPGPGRVGRGGRHRGGDRGRPRRRHGAAGRPRRLGGETLETAGRAAAANLAKAMAEVREAHSPRLLLLDALRALAGTLVALLLGSVLWWLGRRLASRLAAWLDARLVSNLVRHARHDLRRTVEASLVVALRSLGRLILLGLEAALIYAWLTFTLRQFPYTRPWGEALSGFVVATIADLGQGMLYAIPGLFSVALIVVITRVVVRLANIVFRAAEQGRLSLPGVYAETAQPTRRLTVALLWIVAVVVAYPHLPGSGSDAFRGMSVLVGLMLSLGSSGAREPGHEQLHDHVLPRGADRRVREDWRGRGHGRAHRRARHEAPDAAPRGGHASERGRRVLDDHELLAPLGRGRLRRDLGDDRLRHAMAPGGGDAAAGGRAHRRPASRPGAVRAAVGAQGLLRRVHADGGPRATRRPPDRPE